jgi:FkbM family methyltransferase
MPLLAVSAMVLVARRPFSVRLSQEKIASVFPGRPAETVEYIAQSLPAAPEREHAGPLMNWLRQLWHRKPIAVVTVPPDGAEPRGFSGKNAFADQFNLLGPDVGIIFDIGANIGQTAERYLDVFGSACVYCFEPFPGCYGELDRKFGKNTRVRTYPLAVSDVLGTCELHTFVNSVTNSLLPAAPGSAEFVADGQMKETGKVIVGSVTIDDFCCRNKIKRIDILKLDIQGGESRALGGAEKTLRRHNIRLIFTEVNFVSVYSGQCWFFDVASQLQNYGYYLFDFYNFAYSETGQLKWGDAIFLPRK